ncbi:hypothetical protein ALT785_470163 [Alteromonas infernus]
MHLLSLYGEAETHRKSIFGGINQRPYCDQFLMGLHSLLNWDGKKFGKKGINTP